MKASGTAAFAELSRELVTTSRQFAVVLDGVVVTAPTVEGVATDGRGQISGSFSRAGARRLAELLVSGG